MDQRDFNVDIVGSLFGWHFLAVLLGGLLAYALLGALLTKLRQGGVLKEVGRSALFWRVVGCDVGPKAHHISSLMYWRVGNWRVAGRPDLILKHRFLPIVQLFEVKSRSKPSPTVYEFLQVQIYLSAAAQAFPWVIKSAYLVYPKRTLRVGRSRPASRFLRQVLSDVPAHLSSGLSEGDRRFLERSLSNSVG
jgi:hypothetical protein